MTFDFPQQMELIKSALETEGYDTLTHDLQMAGNGYGTAVGGVKLLVRNEAYDEALLFLQEAGYIDADVDNSLQDDTIYLLPASENRGCCPFCDSDNIGKLTYSNALMSFVAKLLSVFPIYRNNFSCEDCGKKWKFIK